MKPVYFRISILLNLGLAAGLAAILMHKPAVQSVPSFTVVNPPAPSAQPTSAEPEPSSPPRRFDWRQIESADYRIFVANLRDVHCPEQVIREIVSADVGNVYSAKRRQLGLDGTKTGPWSRQEEEHLVAFLLGDAAPSVAVAQQPADNNEPQASPAEVPLVFQAVDFAALNLNQGQINAIEDIRERFVSEIGGTNQDPSDPAYRERWVKAQPEMDNLLEGMIGSTAFQNYQLALRGVKFKNGEPEEP
jgi:hypothetical protein